MGAPVVPLFQMTNQEEAPRKSRGINYFNMADGLIDDRFQDASCAYALQKFGLDNFREKQLLALKDLILGRDALVISLPTGFEKSLLFQAFPLVYDRTKVLNRLLWLFSHFFR